ncbi:MAG: ion transporter [Acidobacteria bacterium]|nr:ion transporter [Acidobacteriota bacterium]
MTLRQTLQFYLIDCQTRLGKGIDIFIISMNLLVCILFVLETYPIPEAARHLLWKTEVVVVTFFILEYLLRLYAAENRWRHLRNIYSLIDLVAILPTIFLMFFTDPSKSILFVQIIRVFKVFRIFRFLRFMVDPDFFFGNITMYVLKVVRLALTIFIIFFISSGVFFIVENGINSRVSTFGDAFYYTVVTLTTVGFGDIIPVSETGRWVTVLMIMSGIILIPWQAGQIVREWLRSRKRDITCPTCGLRFHDVDASHCKSCGSVIYQEYEG